MPKPSERSRKMRRLADEAIDIELERLKDKRERLRAIAGQLGQWRDQSQHLRRLARELDAEHGVSKSRLTRILDIKPREATVIWTAANTKNKPATHDGPEDDAKPVETDETMPVQSVAGVPLPAIR